MQLKGNIQVETSKPEIEITESMTQAMVTIEYHLTGVDLSEGIAPTGNEEEDADEADRVKDLKEKELRKYFIDYYRGMEIPENSDPIVNTEEFVGLDCNVTIYGGETIEELKNLSMDIQVSAFYDLPRSSLERTIEDATKPLLGK